MTDATNDAQYHNYDRDVGLFVWIDTQFRCRILKFMTDFNPTSAPFKLFGKGRWICLARSTSKFLEKAEENLWNNIKVKIDSEHLHNPCLFSLVCITKNRDPNRLYFDV